MKQLLYILFFITILYILYFYIIKKLFKEGFINQSNKNYVLLGDSILKNDRYVSDGNSIEDLLTERVKGKKIYCLAEDNSKIVDIYSQVSKIPIYLNNKNTYIFLSAGGNDILSHYVDRNEDITDTHVLKPMFSSYKNLIKSISNRLPNARIIVFDIYYPNNITYKQFHSIIKEWNNMIYGFTNDPNNNIYSIVKISDELTNTNDFSFGIEPSSNGGKKIVDLILSL